MGLCRDGRLREYHRIIEINGQVLNESAALKQAVQLLQAATGKVTLVVVYQPVPEFQGSISSPVSQALSSPHSAVSDFTVRARSLLFDEFIRTLIIYSLDDQLTNLLIDRLFN